MSQSYIGGIITGTLNPLTSLPTATVEYLVVAGGGGGGGFYAGGGSYNGGSGASGGSGIVIISYPNTFKDAVSVTNGTKTSITGFTVYTFTSSGSITF